MRAVSGVIFDIQRNSYVDGPGLRTTLFLKGCNLRCLWCHNPEGIAPQPQYVHYASRCSACGMCLGTCPQGALLRIGQPDEKKCTLCGRCALYCPAAAIRIYGQRVTAGEMLELLVRDKAYFDASGGGLTLSGGECMLQPDFVFALCALCKESGISTAIDTAGHVPWEWLEQMIPAADWFLYDLKAFDSDVHRSLTGVDNALILQNVQNLLKRCPEKVILRIPMIPGANDDEQDSQIEKIVAFLRDLPKPHTVELLPYHRLGEGKRAALGSESFVAAIPPPERMELLRKLF